MTLLAAASTSMPWAAAPPAITVAKTNVKIPVGLFMSCSSSFECVMGREPAAEVASQPAATVTVRFGWSALIVRSGSRLPHLHLFRNRQTRRSEIEGHVVELAVEPKWHLVVLIVDARAGIDPDVEGLVRRQ